jgi:spore maturation protein CgeB
VAPGGVVRALVVRPGPHFSVADVANGWVAGLRANGVEVVDFNFDDRMAFYATAHQERNGDFVRVFENPEDVARLAADGVLAAAYKLWPDIVVIVSGFFVPPEVYALLRSRGHKVVLLHTESPYEDDRQLRRAPHATLNVLNDPTNIDRFREHGPTVYIPHAYDPTIHHPRTPDPAAKSDFCFVGTGFPSRVEFLERCDFTGIDVALAGNWRNLDPDSPLRKHLAHDEDECCPNDQAAILYASTKASANLYRKEATETADGWAMGPREVELAACGTFFLREPRGETDEVLHMLPTFDGPEDFTDKLRWWLAHDATREAAALLARRAIAGRTFKAHAAHLLELLAA